MNLKQIVATIPDKAIQKALADILVVELSVGFRKTRHDIKTDMGLVEIENLGKVFAKFISETLAERLAQAYGKEDAAGAVKDTLAKFANPNDILARMVRERAIKVAMSEDGLKKFAAFKRDLKSGHEGVKKVWAKYGGPWPLPAIKKGDPQPDNVKKAWASIKASHAKKYPAPEKVEVIESDLTI